MDVTVENERETQSRHSIPDSQSITERVHVMVPQVAEQFWQILGILVEQGMMEYGNSRHLVFWPLHFGAELQQLIEAHESGRLCVSCLGPARVQPYQLCSVVKPYRHAKLRVQRAIDPQLVECAAAHRLIEKLGILPRPICKTPPAAGRLPPLDVVVARDNQDTVRPDKFLLH